MFEAGRNCWQVADADRLAIIIDAEDYFAAVRQALLQAERRIMLIGWDFDTRIGLHAKERLPGEPETLGDFIMWLVERTPTLEVYLLRWDKGALKSFARGSTLLTTARWAMHKRIHFKLDGHHPVAASHHQKIVSIDDQLAFCGGIDMTADRWDTREHLHDDPRRVQPNGQPYKPWHDATTALSGSIASVVARECRDRWQRATGNELSAIESRDAKWPEKLKADFRHVPVALARSHPEMPDQTPIREIETLFLDQIQSARGLIYLESQYFASRRVAEAIAARLDEADGPEIVLVNPLTAQGWLEPIAMDTARARLVTALRERDKYRHFAVYHPFTSGGDPIYVHAKITIIDNQSLRVGSANLNNRSMRLDTECDVALEANSDEARASIDMIRMDLLAEHLGTTSENIEVEIKKNGSLITAIEHLRGEGKTLRAYEVPDLNSVEAWLADNEVFDPEGPAEMFEPLGNRGLFRRLRKPLHRLAGLRSGRKASANSGAD
jgi:phosphatidylserine/phosphatidylglycerophosphate/cardiolipin synthase-like enzyme